MNISRQISDATIAKNSFLTVFCVCVCVYMLSLLVMSVLEWEVTDRQGEEAGMIRVVMD